MSYALDKGETLGRLERMRLLSEYNKTRASVTNGGRLERMRGLRRLNEIRALLGAGGGQPLADERISLLQAVLQGAHDQLALGDLLDKIAAAVEGLSSDGRLSGEADALGERAIEHWAGLITVEG